MYTLLRLLREPDATKVSQQLARRKVMTRHLWLLLITVSCSALIIAQTAPGNDRRPFDKNVNAAATKTPVILYHGGPVMVAAKDLYVIYYGSFTATQHSILDTFLQNLGG